MPYHMCCGPHADWTSLRSRALLCPSPGAVRARFGTGARHFARPRKPESDDDKDAFNPKRKARICINCPPPDQSGTAARAPSNTWRSVADRDDATHRLADHTLRAALTGVRKTGVILTRRREGGDTIYAIGPAGPTLAPDGGVGQSADAVEAVPGIEADALAAPPVAAPELPDAAISEPGKGAA